MKRRLKSISLLWRILLSTSVAITVLFALTGYVVQMYAVRVSQRSLEEEVRTSLQAYQAFWGARAHTVAAMGRIISSMSDVRAAFMTGDRATIRDTAGQLWDQVSEQDAAFLVLDPTGKVIASLGGDYPDLALNDQRLEAALKTFPKQVAGYLQGVSHLYYTVLTPVYVESLRGRALLNILLIAVEINDKLAQTLKSSTHGSDFIFTSHDEVAATTLPGVTAGQLRLQSQVRSARSRISPRTGNYLVLATPLQNTDGESIGSLYITRSFAGPEHALAGLQRNVALIWLAAVIIGVGLTYLLARRILEPVKRLDRAAEEVIKQNYDYRIAVEAEDELGRLARTFNTMCESIRKARNDLVRQERISTIGQFATSIVHDLRSPLAAIYGGAEMLVDSDLSPALIRRLALNMYRASRRMQELLGELADAGRGGGRPVEICNIKDLVEAACQSASIPSQSARFTFSVDIPAQIFVAVERGRIERVFVNLIDNAKEAMPDGGSIHIRAWLENNQALVEVRDTGPGLSPEAWASLFQPFASFGKRSGLGLGLALSRQTVLDHGGDLWAGRGTSRGAVFYVRLPVAALPGDSSIDSVLDAEGRGLPR